MDESTSRALRDLLEKAGDDPRVIAVLQYGGSVREGPSRDLDVCLVLDPEVPLRDDFLDYFSLAAGQRHEGLDVSIFQRLPVHVRHRVLDDHRILLVDDEDRLYDVASRTVREWERFRPFYEDHLEAVARG